MDSYEYNLKVSRDLKNVIDYAFEKGKLEGIKEGKLKGFKEGKLEVILEIKLKEKIVIAKTLKELNVSIDIICELTGLSESEINTL